MLSITDSFAKKWRFCFNEKSKILIIGKRLSQKKQQLGCKTFEETLSYKYLGVIINRRLNNNIHIHDHLDSKATTSSSYIRYTLANHADIKRVDFGKSLWHRDVLTGLIHARGIWFNETKSSHNTLLSAQYRCAKSVLNLHSKPSSIATIMDPGCLPMTDELDLKKIAYYKHLREMEGHHTS